MPFLVGYLCCSLSSGGIYVDINESQEKRMKKLLIFSTKTLFNSNVFAELYSAICQTSKMVIFTRVINGLKSIIIFAKKTPSSIFEKTQNMLLYYREKFSAFYKKSFYRKKNLTRSQDQIKCIN